MRKNKLLYDLQKTGIGERERERERESITIKKKLLPEYC